jgi:type IV pilus assembly protein PilQ
VTPDPAIEPAAVVSTDTAAPASAIETAPEALVSEAPATPAEVLAEETAEEPTLPETGPIDTAAAEPLPSAFEEGSSASAEAPTVFPPAGADPAYVMPVQVVEERHDETVVTSAPNGQYVGQRISLDFKDADIQNVLRILADVSGLNIITTEDVGGKLTIRLMDVPWDQALAAILKAQGLDMVRDGNIVRISTVEKLKEERDAQRAADEAQKQAEPLRVRYIRVNYAKADEELVKKVQEVLTERGAATWDERTNTIVVRDIARGVESAVELVNEFDTQTPQVLIEANIVEATESFARDLGVQWGYTYQASPEIGNAPGTNFPGRIGAGGILAGGTNSPASAVPFIADFPAGSVAPGAGAAYDFLLGSLDGAHSLNARLTALERQGKGKVISRPRVVTLNNVPAKIESLEILRVKLPSTGTVISTGAGGAAGGAQNATEQIRTGITLEVTPQVSSDGFIFLDVYAKSSALVPPNQSQVNSPDEIPNEVSREAESHVLIEDGETFVLGGVFRNVLSDDDQGLPFLSSIPVLGWAFKNQRNIDNRQELLVFVTPRAVRARGTENLASLPSAETLWQTRLEP